VTQPQLRDEGTVLVRRNVRKLYPAIVAVLILLVGLLGATSCVSMPVRKFEDTRSMMDTFITILRLRDGLTSFPVRLL